MKSRRHDLSPEQFAQKLQEAREFRTTITPPSDEGEIDLAWASAVQIADRANRVSQGERVVGIKLGLTSAAKQESMKVDQPVFGFLTDRMLETGPISLSSYTQPRIEPELVFKIGKSISSPITLEAAPVYIDSITVGFEIIDSRYPNFNFTFLDVIADNSSAATFGIGEWIPWSGQVLSNYSGHIEKEGRTIASGSLREILGNPLNTIVAASNFVHQEGSTLPAGSILLAGAMTNAFPLEIGNYGCRIDGIGELEVKVI